MNVIVFEFVHMNCDMNLLVALADISKCVRFELMKENKRKKRKRGGFRQEVRAGVYRYFYPSITEHLLERSLEFAGSFVELNDKDLQAIRHARKWLLFKDGEPWTKRNNENFDVSMGAYDGAEVCELVGIYILHSLAKDFEKSFTGLYRDDGLAYFKNISGRQADIIRKKFHEIFERFGFQVEIQCNL